MNNVIGTPLFKEKNESEKWVALPDGRMVFFKSGENYQDLRVETLDGAIVDEYRQQHPDLWPQVIRPMLARRKGWADFLSTPNGFDHFYDLAKYAMNNETNEWGFYKAPSTDAWWWSPEEIASAKASMSELEFAQEIMAEFVNLTAHRVYHSFTDVNKANECPWWTGKLYSPHHSIVLGADFNLSPMSWTLGQYRDQDWWWFSEINLKDSHTPEASKELVRRIQEFKAQGYRAPVDLIVCGDASSKGGQRAAAGQSDYDILFTILRQNGISFQDRTPDSNPGIKDRINTVNGRCKDAAGTPHMWIHPTQCPALVKDLERVTWKQGNSLVLDPGPLRELTHPSDSIGYPIVALTPIKSQNNVGKVHILQRTF